MTQYLLSVYQPDGPVPAPEILEGIIEDIEALNQELKAAGALVFSGGLYPPEKATVLRPRSGEVLVTDGPFAEAEDHLGGFTIIEAPDLDAALDWGRKLAAATTLPIEVRPFQQGPED
ncbi:YciI family protein [Rhodococcus maanshanensis]|uniref:Uncharacterized conserved protein n=1 Tax=Rhodococcus maanshanensis TaxID=183556 RepID=A0A1H7PRV6_9NOCA|nr:YciI family protein [Rhodococcus maanshanensis]SEL38601.1 Uncharacterized conserved protein [Rhodococcus maanshanensis]